MIFQKKTPVSLESELPENPVLSQETPADEVETVVGPSVNVEGDLSSAGNIIVKGTVSGSVHTTKHLAVERGAKIIANVSASTALISGEVRGNLRIKENLELTSTAKILGDITVKLLSVEGGAVVCGKISMPGLEAEKKIRTVKIIRKIDEDQIS